MKEHEQAAAGNGIAAVELVAHVIRAGQVVALQNSRRSIFKSGLAKTILRAARRASR